MNAPRKPPGAAEERVGGLDLMRAAAISLVLIHHLSGLVADRVPWLHGLLASGPLGVDIFFALSGFLIGRILLGLDDRIGTPRVLVLFWSRRWLRTLPLYYLILFVHVAWALGRNGHPAAIARAASTYLWFGQSLTSRPPFFFGESWSLVVEEWFYLLFPLVWSMAVRAGIKPALGYALCGVVMLVTPLALRLYLDPGVPRLWYYDVAMIAIYRMDSIAMGVLAAACSIWRPAFWGRFRHSSFALGLLLLAADWVTLVNARFHSDAFMRVWHFTLTGIGCVLLLPLLSSIRAFPSIRVGRAISAMARWSYALYLTNALLLAVARSLFPTLLESSATWDWLMMLLVLVSSLVVSAGLHRWFERPIMDLRRRLPNVRTGPANG